MLKTAILQSHKRSQVSKLRWLCPGSSKFQELRVRAKKRNKHARVLIVRQASRQAQSLIEKIGGIFVDRLNKKVYELRMLSKYSRQATTILTSPMKNWCIVFMGNKFFSYKNNLKTVSKNFIFLGTQEISIRREIYPHSLHIVYL